MASTMVSIACLGVIGRNNNPLHMTVFAPRDGAGPARTPLQFSLLLSSTMDVFEQRAQQQGARAAGDAWLVHAVDDRLAAYGSETNTGVRLVCVVDMRGRRAAGPRAPGVGLRDAELKPVFRAMHAAYVRLLQNPFFDPDHHAPLATRGATPIASKRFADDMRSIGEVWAPGVTNL